MASRSQTSIRNLLNAAIEASAGRILSGPAGTALPVVLVNVAVADSLKPHQPNRTPKPQSVTAATEPRGTNCSWYAKSVSVWLAVRPVPKDTKNAGLFLQCGSRT